MSIAPIRRPPPLRGSIGRSRSHAAAAQEDERKRPVVIAHRGASGYLPENTLPAFSMAHALGADAIELDVVLTRDGVPIALHDLTLEDTTNVREVFPERAGTEGHWWARDFDLEEIQRLQVRERFSTRFRQDSAGGFRVPTLTETLQLVAELNRGMARDLALFVELKGAAFHREHGADLEKGVVETLGSDPSTAGIHVAIVAEEPASLRHLRFDLEAPYRLVQIIDQTAAFDAMTTPRGLDAIAHYADAIGPEKRRIEAATGEPVADNRLVREARGRGLAVYPFTFRADEFPSDPDGFQRELERFFLHYGVDGVFTDFPDQTAACLARVSARVPTAVQV